MGADLTTSIPGIPPELVFSSQSLKGQLKNQLEIKQREHVLMGSLTIVLFTRLPNLWCLCWEDHGIFNSFRCRRQRSPESCSS